MNSYKTGKKNEYQIVRIGSIHYIETAHFININKTI